jgi:hypothetical protein
MRDLKQGDQFAFITCSHADIERQNNEKGSSAGHASHSMGKEIKKKKTYF